MTLYFIDSLQFGRGKDVFPDVCAPHPSLLTGFFFFSRYQGMENQLVSFSLVKWKIVISSYAQ